MLSATQRSCQIVLIVTINNRGKPGVIIYTYEYQVYSKIVMNDVTTIKVTKKTKDRLAELGKKNETYEDIIEMLVEFYEKRSVGRVRNHGKA